MKVTIFNLPIIRSINLINLVIENDKSNGISAMAKA